MRGEPEFEDWPTYGEASHHAVLSSSFGLREMTRKCEMSTSSRTLRATCQSGHRRENRVPVSWKVWENLWFFSFAFPQEWLSQEKTQGDWETEKGIMCSKVLTGALRCSLSHPFLWGWLQSCGTAWQCKQLRCQENPHLLTRRPGKWGPRLERERRITERRELQKGSL
jgi:hypothetical protein